MSDGEKKCPGSDLLSLYLNKEEKPDQTPDVNNDKGSGVSSLFFCKNEDHNPPKGFPTLAQLKIHILKFHKCPVPKCSFANEKNEVLVEHFDKTHVQTFDICDLCCAPMASDGKQQHYLQCHAQCNACHAWFIDYQTLKSHELKCVTVTPFPVEENSSTKFIASKCEENSLNIDKSNVMKNFSSTLIKMLTKLNFSKEEIEEGTSVINRYASEKLIARRRERGRVDDPRRQNDLFFSVPTFCTNPEESNSKDLHHYLKQIKINQFDASAMDSSSFAVDNFLAIEKINQKINHITIACKLTCEHAVCIFEKFLSQRVQDEVQAYKKMCVCDLNYRSLLQTLQYLYCPVDLSRVEQNVLGAEKGKKQNIFQFAAEVYSKLDLCSRKLQPEERDSYIEIHLRKCIFLNLDQKIQREIEAKESIWSSFSSTELLDFALSNQQEECSSQYYEHFSFNQVGQNDQNDESENESEYDSDCVSEKSEPESEPEPPDPAMSRFHPDYARNDPLKKKLQNLCFIDKKFSRGVWCLFCLSRHHYWKCKSYSGDLNDNLHFNNNQPCGFHTEEECLSKSWEGKIKDEY